LAFLPGLAAAEPLRAPVRLEAPVQDKNFYLLSLLERTPDVREAVQAEPVLARIAAERLATLDKAVKTCNLDIDCMRWRLYIGLRRPCAAWRMEPCGKAACTSAIEP
jgi:hypothetical protein